jgi:hypothetical protein
MNRNQYTQHQEQMEAYRKEFAEVWIEQLERNRSTLSAQELALVELIMWNQWRVARHCQTITTLERRIKEMGK